MLKDAFATFEDIGWSCGLLVVEILTPKELR